MSQDMGEQLLARISNRTARVSVVGLGYVGLPLAVEFAKAGFRVVGLEVDQRKVEQMWAGQSYISDVPQAELDALVAEGLLTATMDYSMLAEVDTISICVPTPLRKSKDPDISYIVAATEGIARYSHPGQLVVLESTTYPGTTEEVILSRISADGYKVGQDFFLAFSPERVDPGNKRYGTRNTPKIIGGVTPRCLEIACALYQTAVDAIVPVSSTRVAEMVKLLENTFRAVNIGLVNEIAIMCDKLGIDVWEVIEAAKTKPFGFMPFYPGPGLGGHCIPIDPNYLSWKLKTLNYHARFIELAGEINSAMPLYVVGKTIDALNELRKPLNGSQVLVLGVAYKRDVKDVRESPALDIIRLLKEKGAQVAYHDPYVPELPLDGEVLNSVALKASVLSEADCVLVTTDHSLYDWPWVVANSRLVVDTRNVTQGIHGKATIVRL
jgi:UDP-N-acetyl-D-glucosamine dehydrogenase